MLPRDGLFDRTFSVLAEIRHSDNSTSWQISGHSIGLGLRRRRDLQKERKLYLHGTVLQLCCKLHLRYKQEAENDLVVSILSILKAAWTAWEWMNFW